MNSFFYTLAIIIMILYTISMLVVLFQSICQGYLIWKYIGAKKQTIIAENKITTYPKVCVQLPLYNEEYVVERLINAACNLSYPKDKLEVQVLDDSTDDSLQLTKQLIDYWKIEGYNITHVQRSNRNGFKAGALENGLQITDAKLIAVFDADFIPNQNFLIDTVAHFENDKIGMVQTRWGHLNEEYSLLTRLQAFGLNAHFTIEQSGRAAGGYFFNFNGTAGIWRKQCIVEAGNWHADTLTEDLDLSYRAQLKGWQFKYVEESVQPAELPPAIAAFKSQQYRWMKGGAETAKKHIPSILKAKLPLGIKFHAVAHLMASTIFFLVFITGLLSVPLLIIKHNMPETALFFKFITLFLFGIVVFAVHYFVSCLHTHENVKKAIKKFITSTPLFLAFNMGMSFHNGVAVIEGWMGKKTPFIRTPKFNLSVEKTTWTKNKYVLKSFSWINIVEVLLLLYFIAGIVLGFYYKDYGLFLYHALLTIGFGMVNFYTVKHSFVKA